MKILRLEMTPKYSLGLYKIIYEKNGFVQYKHLIDKEMYSTVFLSLMAEITELEIVQTKKNKSETENRIRAIKKQLKQEFGEYFLLTESPLHQAIKTGVIKLLPHMGGEHKAKVQII